MVGYGMSFNLLGEAQSPCALRLPSRPPNPSVWPCPCGHFNHVFLFLAAVLSGQPSCSMRSANSAAAKNVWCFLSENIFFKKIKKRRSFIGRKERGRTNEFWPFGGGTEGVYGRSRTAELHFFTGSVALAHWLVRDSEVCFHLLLLLQ